MGWEPLLGYCVGRSSLRGVVSADFARNPTSCHGTSAQLPCKNGPSLSGQQKAPGQLCKQQWADRGCLKVMSLYDKQSLGKSEHGNHMRSARRSVKYDCSDLTLLQNVWSTGTRTRVWLKAPVCRGKRRGLRKKGIFAWLLRGPVKAVWRCMPTSRTTPAVVRELIPFCM